MTKKKNIARFPMYSAFNHMESLSLSDSEITPQARSLYYALLNICMQIGGYTTFSITYQYIMQVTRIGSQTTYYKTLELLQNKRLINYEKGSNRFQAAKITLLFDEDTSSLLRTYKEAISKSINIPIVKPANKSIHNTTIDNIKDMEDTSDDKKIYDNKDTPSRMEAQAVSTPFEQFWAAYGKNVKKDAARKEWKKLPEEIQKEIMELIPKYIESKPDKMFRKDPVNFLKEETWKDEIITIKTKENDEIRRLFVGIQDYKRKSF